MNTTSSHSRNEIPFAFGMDYVVSKEDNKIYCLEINTGDAFYLERPGSGGYYQLERGEFSGTIKNILIGITHKPYPNKLFQLTKRKSDQLLFIPREHCPETLVLDKNDFSVFGEKDQSRLEIEKRLMKKRLLIGKTDTGFQGRGTSLITTEEFLEDSKSLSKALQGNLFDNTVFAMSNMSILGYLWLTSQLGNMSGFDVSDDTIMGYTYNFMREAYGGYLLVYFLGHIYLPKHFYNKNDKIILQEYIFPKSADLGPVDRPACMRHLIHGKYNIETQEITSTINTFAQRLGDVVNPDNLEHKSGIINYSSRGTQVVHASTAEKEQAQKLTHKIIHNIFSEVYPTKEKKASD